jgi:predicted DNA-binding transcriptional regulator AlpA
MTVEQLAPQRPKKQPRTAPQLTARVRFKDLVAANLVHNWPTLRRLIREQQFPAGKMIGPNMRSWSVVEIEAWVASRPTDISNIRILGGSKQPKKATD